ncbi:MAG: hypothetical protein PHP47_02990 [Candidatus Pacebacteria bacterium]|jgi:hypothetical protein|nr:hypothetical protein [Candidatus Paceibacterota bacterium]
MLRKILLALIVVFIFLALAGAWYWQKNIYSREILKIEIIAPKEVDLFEEVEYTVKYKNNGNIRLEEPRLIFEFPEYTILEDGKERRIDIGKDELSDIYPGEERTISFKGRIVGGEGEVKTAKALLSYRPKNLKPRYESSTSFASVIKQIPVTFDIDLPSRVEAGREVRASLNYFSNLNYPLMDLVFKVNYPSGFRFTESSPLPFDDNEWHISLLNRSEGGRIEIKGELGGEVRDQRVFYAELGIQQDNNYIILKKTSKGVEITRPSLHIFQRINNSDRYAANPGDLLRYEIFFRNIGGEPFSDLFLVSRLNGDFFDFESVRAEYGQYNSSDKTIIWDWRDVPSLRFLNEGEEGKVEFWVRVRNNIDPGLSENFSLKNHVSVARISEEFITKINTRLSVSQKGYYRDDVFGNTGPVPPKVGEKTTYTITWQAENWYNNVRDAKVKAFLPENISLTGKIFPEEETINFTFDSQSREIIWNIGDISAQKTIRSIAFQVALTPLPGQLGETLQIIHSARISGDDMWTENSIQGASPGIDTTLTHDDSVSIEDGVVE